MIKRVLILGGTGYLGSWLAYDLASKGYGVSVLGRFNPRPGYPAWVDLMDQIILGDVRDEAVLRRPGDDAFDAIINLVSLGPQQSGISPETAFAVDILPTWVLLRHCAGRRLQRYIYFSTERVFDGRPEADAGPDTPVAPVSQYGLTHALTEQVVDYFDRTAPVDAIVARLASSYGSPRFREANWKAPVINRFCCMAADDGVIRLHSDGLAQRDFVHITDVARFVTTVLGADTLPRALYHVGSGRKRSVRSAAHHVAQAYHARCGQHVEVLLPDGRVCEPPDSLEMLGEENRRVTESLCSIGCEPMTPFADGVNEVLDYLMAPSK